MYQQCFAQYMNKTLIPFNQSKPPFLTLKACNDTILISTEAFLLIDSIRGVFQIVTPLAFILGVSRTRNNWYLMLEQHNSDCIYVIVTKVNILFCFFPLPAANLLYSSLLSENAMKGHPSWNNFFICESLFLFLLIKRNTCNFQGYSITLMVHIIQS